MTCPICLRLQENKPMNILSKDFQWELPGNVKYPLCWSEDTFCSYTNSKTQTFYLSFRKINFRYKRVHYPRRYPQTSNSENCISSFLKQMPSLKSSYNLPILTAANWFIFNHTFTECLLKAHQPSLSKALSYGGKNIANSLIRKTEIFQIIRIKCLWRVSEF